jgi:hypothetical protein
MGNKICQSCGMPMLNKDFGTNKDGGKNNEFCHFCFKEGKFNDEGISMTEKINKNIQIAIKMGMTQEQAKSLAENTIPKLKRWKK